MESPTKADEPRPGTERMRPTTLSLSRQQWEWLQQIEDRTGARPSVTVRRLIDRARRCKPPQPAA